MATWNLSAYSSNRTAKRLNEAKKEEMRKQDLLGRKDKALPDLAVKYKDGYTAPQIIEEIIIRLFRIQSFIFIASNVCLLYP